MITDRSGKVRIYLHDENGFLQQESGGVCLCVCVCVCVPHSRCDAPQHTNQLDHWELPIILLQNNKP